MTLQSEQALKAILNSVPMTPKASALGTCLGRPPDLPPQRPPYPQVKMTASPLKGSLRPQSEWNLNPASATYHVWGPETPLPREHTQDAEGARRDDGGGGDAGTGDMTETTGGRRGRGDEGDGG